MYKHFDIFLFIFLVSFDFSMCNIHWQMDSMHVGRCACVGCQMLFRSWMLVSSIAYLKHQYTYIPYAKWTTKRERERENTTESKIEWNTSAPHRCDFDILAFERQTKQFDSEFFLWSMHM